MDGAKVIADTADYSKDSGRQASQLGRSTSERAYGPIGNENPGGSRIREQ
jgi:hypothetical protein